MWYSELKVFLVQYSGLEKDALHIHLAILLYMIAMVIFRQTRKSRIPWLFVLAVELANEVYDLHGLYLYDMPLTWAESAKDLWNTMLWPTVLLFVGRYTTLFEHRSRHPNDDAATPPPPAPVPRSSLE